MTLIISSMCPLCKTWQRLKSGKGRCMGCGYNFYDGNLYATSFVESKTTDKKLCVDCGQENWAYPDGSCPNCEHNRRQNDKSKLKCAQRTAASQAEIDAYFNGSKMKEKLKFRAANDAVKFPPEMNISDAIFMHFAGQAAKERQPHKIETNPYSKEVCIPLSKEERKKLFESIGKLVNAEEEFPNTYQIALDHFVEGQKLNVRDPKEERDKFIAKTLSEMGIKEIEGEDNSKCPGCLRPTFPRGKCPNTECNYDFDAHIAKYGYFPDYDFHKGGWKFGKTMAYGKRAFDANVVIEDMEKKFQEVKLPKIHARIEELKAIRYISLDGCVAIPSDKDLDKVNSFLQNYYPIELEGDLLIYPTYRADEIRFEWQFKTDDITIDLNLNTWNGYYHRVCRTLGRTSDAFVDFNKAKDWEIVLLKIMEVKDENKA